MFYIIPTIVVLILIFGYLTGFEVFKSPGAIMFGIPGETKFVIIVAKGQGGSVQSVTIEDDEEPENKED